MQWHALNVNTEAESCMQGEAGDQFYIVKEGEAVVYQSTPQGVKTVNRLFKADFFGERALLTQEPRCPLPHCPEPLLSHVSSNRLMLCKGHLSCITSRGKRVWWPRRVVC